jgi:hypothetical protein
VALKAVPLDYSKAMFGSQELRGIGKYSNNDGEHFLEIGFNSWDPNRP